MLALFSTPHPAFPHVPLKQARAPSALQRQPCQEGRSFATLRGSTERGVFCRQQLRALQPLQEGLITAGGVWGAGAEFARLPLFPPLELRRSVSTMAAPVGQFSRPVAPIFSVILWLLSTAPQVSEATSPAFFPLILPSQLGGEPPIGQTAGEHPCRRMSRALGSPEVPLQLAIAVLFLFSVWWAHVWKKGGLSSEFFFSVCFLGYSGDPLYKGGSFGSMLQCSGGRLGRSTLGESGEWG